MVEKRTYVCNEIGVAWHNDADRVRIKDIKVYQENGTVLVWIGIDLHGGVLGIDEVLAYLTPEEAMTFSKAFERCAIAALKESS